MAIFTLYYVFFFSSLLYCSATDAIMTNKCISDGETLVSAGEIFQLGFFTPDGSLSSSARYVGIWYYNSTPQTVVWVANRESPLSDRSGIFCVTKYGNLEVQHANKSYWSTELELPLSKTTAELMDTGNLVLRNDTSLEILWDSFSCPTDTFLPGMKMDGKLKLTSWKSRDDPAKGNFTFQRDGVDQFVIQKRVHQFMIGKKSDGWYNYWRSEADGTFLLSIDYLLSNISRKTAAGCGRDYSYPACLPRTNQNDDVGDSKRRLVMSFTGEIQYLRWFDFERNWSLSWWAPRDQCGASDACGKFGSCNSNNGLVCKCLPGFEPRWKDQWESGYFSGGCEPKWPICGLNNGKIIGTFLSLTVMRVKNTDDVSRTTSETECRKECLENCNCQAYSYDDEAEDNSTSTITGVCSFWKDDLSNIQEEYADGGRNLSVRVNVSDIESTPRTCRTCGTNVIPYPLSTQSSCGDLIYSGFHCNITSGQVSFMTPNATYRVTNIDPKLLKFVIQAKGSGNCKGGNSTGEIPKLNKPFQAVNRCNNPDPGNHSPVMLSRGRDEIDVSWDPPREPSCNSSRDCRYWPNSNCNNATQGGERRCLCNAKFQWNGSSLNCTPELPKKKEPPSPTKKELPTPTKMSRPPIIIAVTITAAIVLIVVPSTIVYYSRLRRRRAARRQGNKENIHRNQALHLDDSERRVKDLLDSDQFREEDKQGIDVPFFDLKSILAATDDFSDANKLGKGGFGPVYKGKFPGGREIAIKKLSNVSGQGIEEFKTEIVLIAKLQHRNLVRLLGYCIEGEEKLLVYEYMPNKSLDSFIFDRTLCVVLDWELRFNIIVGIARGLLYLHQDSRLKIIHRDLKTSNILLDEDMNPKISDFGLARIFGGKQIEATTNRVVGTYGYMSPEYANYGFFSIKSDVFSFGVVVLEIISGKKTTGFYQSEEALSLLGYAWRLWNEDKALDLMDRTLFETCNTSEFLKCINVGLLCVQDDPSDRPTMSNVVFMLGSEGATIPAPKKPIFIARRGPSSTTSSSSKPETCSNNELTVTVEEGR